MNKESREPSPARRPARKSGLAARPHRDDLALSIAPPRPGSGSNRQIAGTIESLPTLRDENKAKHESETTCVRLSFPTFIPI